MVFTMRELKMNVTETIGYAVTVEIEGSLEDYAKHLLHIFNNVREHKVLKKVVNHYDSNDVTVYCTSDAREETIKYLEEFGHVKSYAKVLMYQLEEPDYDINKYDDAIVIPEFE